MEARSFSRPEALIINDTCFADRFSLTKLVSRISISLPLEELGPLVPEVGWVSDAEV